MLRSLKGNIDMTLAGITRVKGRLLEHNMVGWCRARAGASSLLWLLVLLAASAQGHGLWQSGLPLLKGESRDWRSIARSEHTAGEGETLHAVPRGAAS